MKPFEKIALLLVFILSITVMPKMHPPAGPVVAYSFENAELDRHAAKLETIATPVENKNDIDLLFEAIGDRRTVLLGEASHGTREFYEWRAKITRRLIEEKNFSFIAVEGDWDAFVPVNRYVKNKEGAPKSASEALRGLDRWPRWMWANHEVLELVKWLRKYNEDKNVDEKVGFYGMDIYGVAGSLEKALVHMEKTGEEATRKTKAAIDCFSPYAGHPQKYIRLVLNREVRCDNDIAEVIDYLQKNEKAIFQQNRRTWLHAAQNAAVIHRAEKHYRKMINRDASSWNARAGNFFETIERLKQFYGKNSGAVAWAHNTHVGDVRATKSAAGMENLGMHARDRLGAENVFIIGFGTHRGKVTAARTWEGKRETMHIPEAMTGSLEDVLNRLNQPLLLIMTDRANDIAFTREFIGHRAIGVTYNPLDEAHNYVPTNWPERYDAFFFIEKTSPLTPLHDSE